MVTEAVAVESARLWKPSLLGMGRRMLWRVTSHLTAACVLRFGHLPTITEASVLPPVMALCATRLGPTIMALWLACKVWGQAAAAAAPGCGDQINLPATIKPLSSLVFGILCDLPYLFIMLCHLHSHPVYSFKRKPPPTCIPLSRAPAVADCASTITSIRRSRALSSIGVGITSGASERTFSCTVEAGSCFTVHIEPLAERGQVWGFWWHLFTDHQSQTKISWLKTVPFGQRKETG